MEPTPDQTTYQETRQLRDILQASNALDSRIDIVAGHTADQSLSSREKLKEKRTQVSAIRSGIEALKQQIASYKTPIELARERSEELFAKQQQTTRIVTEIDNLVDNVQPGDSYDTLCKSLTGIGSEESMELRKKIILKRPELPMRSHIVKGLVAVGTREAMQMRQDFIDEVIQSSSLETYSKIIYLNDIAESLAGVDTPEAMQMRMDLKDSLYTLIQNPDTSQFKKDEEDLLRALNVSLTGIDSPEAMQMRKELLGAELYTEPESTMVWRASVQSLAGVDSSESMQMRQKVIDNLVDVKYLNKDIRDSRLSAVLDSLIGVGTSEAMQMRRDLISKFPFPYVKGYVAKSLAGVGTPEAMQMRQGFLADLNVDKHKIIIGLAGVGSVEAWEIRKKAFLDGRTRKKFAAGGNATNLDKTERFKLDKSTARSLAGVNDDFNFSFRDTYLKNLIDQSFNTDFITLDAVVCRYGWENGDTT